MASKDQTEGANSMQDTSAPVSDSEPRARETWGRETLALARMQDVHPQPENVGGPSTANAV